MRQGLAICASIFRRDRAGNGHYIAARLNRRARQHTLRRLGGGIAPARPRAVVDFISIAAYNICAMSSRVGNREIIGAVEVLIINIISRSAASVLSLQKRQQHVEIKLKFGVTDGGGDLGASWRFALGWGKAVGKFAGSEEKWLACVRPSMGGGNGALIRRPIVRLDGGEECEIDASNAARWASSGNF